MSTVQHTPVRFGFQNEAAHRFPQLILVALTSPCNAQCPHCPSTPANDGGEIRRTPGPDGNQENFLRPEWYKNMSDECATYGARLRLSSYGETMLHPKFVELVEYSSDRGVPTSIITNGSLLTPAKAECLIRAGVESIEISMETHDPELYPKLKVGLKFEKVLQNLKALREIRDRLWSNPVGNHLTTKLRTFIIVSIVNQPKNPTIKEAEAFYQGIADHVSIRAFLTWGLDSLENQNPSRNHYLKNSTPCPYPYERCMVDPAGYIRLCPYDDQKKISPFGHLSTNSISETWQGVRWNEIRSCHGETFDTEAAATKAPLCEHCSDRRNRSWTFNYISIAAAKSGRG